MAKEWLRSAGVYTLVNLILAAGISYCFNVKIEKMKPLTAEETLRRENLLNSKRQVYYEALDVALRIMAARPTRDPGAPKTRKLGTMPSEAEINACQARLALFAENPEVVSAYFHLVVLPDVSRLWRFIDIIRKDLGYGSVKVTRDSLFYLYPREPIPGR